MWIKRVPILWLKRVREISEERKRGMLSW